MEKARSEGDLEDEAGRDGEETLRTYGRGRKRGYFPSRFTAQEGSEGNLNAL